MFHFRCGCSKELILSRIQICVQLPKTYPGYVGFASVLVKVGKVMYICRRVETLVLSDKMEIITEMKFR